MFKKTCGVVGILVYAVHLEILYFFFNIFTIFEKIQNPKNQFMELNADKNIKTLIYSSTNLLRRGFAKWWKRHYSFGGSIMSQIFGMQMNEQKLVLKKCWAPPTISLFLNCFMWFWNSAYTHIFSKILSSTF